LAFEFYNESYAGSVMEVTLGKGDKAVTVGGESCYPFYQFEGDMPHRPRIAMEIWDMAPEEWPEAPWRLSRTWLATQRHGPKSAWTTTAPK
jgi:acetyl-CoA decarbonylase/synthase complex subunit delta